MLMKNTQKKPNDELCSENVIVDEVTTISNEEMKEQLYNTDDIITKLDLAPPTKKFMHMFETEKLFTLPGRFLNAKRIAQDYKKNMDRCHDEETMIEEEDTSNDNVTRFTEQKNRRKEFREAFKLKKTEDLVNLALFPSLPTQIVKNIIVKIGPYSR